MKICAKTALVLLKLLHVTLLPVVDAQQSKVQHEVVGHRGHNVTLSCQPNQESKMSQINWKFKPPEGKEEMIAVYSVMYGLNVTSSLAGRVKLTNHSLTIKDVRVTDKGLYTCEMALFPEGSQEETISLDVQEQTPSSSAAVAAVAAAAAVLLLVIVATLVYLVFFRRARSSNMNHVHIDTSGPLMDMDSPSHTVREEDVVYSDVRLQPSRQTSSSDRDTETAQADNVTYSEVIIMRPQ